MKELSKDIVERILDHRMDILTVCAKFGAHNVRLFGSCARGDYEADSDVDLLVEFDNFDITRLVKLQKELQKLLRCKVDISTDELLRDEIRTNVLSEATAL